MAGITGKKPLEFGAQTIADLKTALGLGDNEDLLSFFYTPVDLTDDHTLELTDAWKSLTMTASTAKAFTFPLNSVVAFPLNARIEFHRYGSGDVSFIATSGVTLNSEDAMLKIGARWCAVIATQIAINTWVLEGRLKA